VTTSREEAHARDVTDPLRSFQTAFIPSTSTAVYADGNSLGPAPRGTATRIASLVDEWADSRVHGWERWVDFPVEVGNRLGATCLGAGADQVVVCDSTSINLVKALGAALDAMPARARLVVARDEFPTDRYIVAALGRQRRVDVRLVDTGRQVIDACDSSTVAVVSAVNYRSGELLDVAAATAQAHSAGAQLVWDVSHAVGVVPLELDAAGVSLAVGCTYKYLNAGPGAPAFVYVGRDAQERVHNPMWGWFGQHDQFLMGPEYAPAAGMRSWLVGTPNVLGTAAVDEGVALIAAAGMEAIRAKSEALTALAVELADAHLVPLGWSLVTPRDPARRGGHVGFSHPMAKRVCDELNARHLVIADFREPDVLRLGFSPLHSRYVDVYDAIAATAEVFTSL
jgi:kynureninase